MSMPSPIPLLLPLPLQVLLVEDSPGDVRLTKEAVRETGASLDLHVVSGGAEAIAFLSREGTNIHAPRPDLILLDLYLPKLDGRVVLAHIKGNDNLKTIPTVILTASDSESDVVKSYQLQANGYLRKPHQWCEFKALVKGIFRFWLKVVGLPPLNEAHQEDSTPECLWFPVRPEPLATEFSAFPGVKPPVISWPDSSAASMGKQREYCARCKHTKSDHQNRRCDAMVQQEPRRFLQCGCKEFIPANADPSQAAAG